MTLPCIMFFAYICLPGTPALLTLLLISFLFQLVPFPLMAFVFDDPMSCTKLTYKVLRGNLWNYGKLTSSYR